MTKASTAKVTSKFRNLNKDLEVSHDGAACLNKDTMDDIKNKFCL